jgi:hypothetical protein
MFEIFDSKCKCLQGRCIEGSNFPAYLLKAFWKIFSYTSLFNYVFIRVETHVVMAGVLKAQIFQTIYY